MATNDKRQNELRSAKMLKPHPLQATYFGDLNDAELEALADDMLENGQLTPVEILPDGTIVCGHQRVRAAIRNQRKVRCWVRHDLVEQGEAAVEQRFLEDNLHRRQLSDLEIARSYVRLLELRRQHSHNGTYTGDVRDEVGAILGKSGRHLDRLAKVLKTPQHVQKAYEAKQITLEQASRVALVDRQTQKKIAKRIRAGEKPRAVIELLAPPKPSQHNPVGRLIGDLRRTAREQLEILNTIDVDLLREKLKPNDAELLTAYSESLRSLVTQPTEA